MTVTDKSFYHLEQGGQSHYFCGAKCKGRFAANLARYTASANGEVVTPPQQDVARVLPAHYVWMLSAGAVVALAVLARWLA